MKNTPSIQLYPIYLSNSSFIDVLTSNIWCPSDVFYDMLMLPQITFTFFIRNRPYPHSLDNNNNISLTITITVTITTITRTITITTSQKNISLVKVCEYDLNWKNRVSFARIIQLNFMIKIISLLLFIFICCYFVYWEWE